MKKNTSGKTRRDAFKHPAEATLLGGAILKVSENRLAQKLGIKPARLRLWRNEFLNIGQSTGRGKSILYTKRDVFHVMLCVELIRHGTKRQDAVQILHDVEISDSNYIYRETVWVPGPDQFEVKSWKTAQELPSFDAKETLSHSIINLDSLRSKVEKILG